MFEQNNKNMLDAILSLISPKVTLYVSPETFVFESKKLTLTLGTWLYFADISGGRRILGVGETFEGCEKCIRLDLFKRCVIPDLDQFACLVDYFRFAFHKLSNRRVLVRPIANFRNTESLNELLCGYGKALLKQTASEAGAHTVNFL